MCGKKIAALTLVAASADMRDLGAVFDHEEPLLHPTCDRAQQNMRDEATRHRPCCGSSWQGARLCSTACVAPAIAVAGGGARVAPDATRPPGWKPAACNRWACGALRSRAKRGPCDALPSVAMTMTGRARLAVPCDVHECPSQFVGQRSIRRSNASAAGDDVESQNGQFAQFFFKRAASLSKLSLRSCRRGALRW